jgi:hypothetical protein
VNKKLLEEVKGKIDNILEHVFKCQGLRGHHTATRPIVSGLHEIKSILSDERLSKGMDSTVAPEDKWISVEDRLPECLVIPSNLRRVFVLLKDGRIERAEYFESSGIFFDEWSDEFESVVMWQYDDLPKPPHNPSKEGE